MPEELYANALDTSLFWSNVYDLLKNANERDDSSKCVHTIKMNCLISNKLMNIFRKCLGLHRIPEQMRREW